MGMVDVSEKPIILRQASAEGRIVLSLETVEKIKAGQIRKGDPFAAGEMAAMNAAKQTHLLIPHCHQIPLDQVRVAFLIDGPAVKATCFVKARARTGVEMEALVGVSMALNTIWDMVKYLEKDPDGQYPSTRIADIMVVKKEKFE